MVHDQKNRRIHSGHGFTGSFDAPIDPDRSWITDPDPDHLKGMRPKIARFSSY